ncbi:hypothetical protein TraAM80_07495 [Trypanosoma rangeli]|uniref:Uncharacterized protein n=1 Tax=Trypanosoma rangeli TaxID=5698 RepID=A0A422N566_TRYRA|nr:uncharacterized protein TraAM80_07495 [Trypanosoma rangeli]RNF00562.1 hypothetical protein TraAM80_07495 [Trypanosoma rangeli]|eukprot:RNF00562.1 hypothetical protein TraAM80_07495 [Trypanosoma rangeli]
MRRCLSACGLLARVATTHRGVGRCVPPPLPPGARGTPPRVAASGRLPPPPPLPGAVAASASAVLPWKSPQEVLTAFIEFIPTFYVPIHCVAAILSEECRKHFIGRGRFLSFLKRYRFFFELRVIDGVRCDVKLRDDLSHPRRGVADEKFVMTDVGDVINYVAKSEFIVSIESIEQGNTSVALKPVCAPPAVHVRLEEKVPVLERLKALVPDEFALLDHVEEDIPEDVLFHPYFDCQGGLISIASKFPEFFQVVDGMIRRRPPHLAPLALNSYTLEESPIPSIAALVEKEVCDSDIPHWVSITSLYEQLTREQKRQIKREYKSFAGFLRSHGRSLSLSQDMLQVAKWTPQTRKTAPSTSSPVAAGAAESRIETTNSERNSNDVVEAEAAKAQAHGVTIHYEYTHTQIINELFDKFPPHRTLNLEELLDLVSPAMRPSLPKKVLAWLASYPTYFLVDDSTERDPLKARIRRASDRQPLDVALELYQCIPDDGISEAALLTKLPEVHREYVKRIGLKHIVNSLSEWLSLTEVTGGAAGEKKVLVLRRLQTEVDLQRAIHSEESKVEGRDEGSASVLFEQPELQRRRLKYEGRMNQPQPHTARAHQRGGHGGF